MTTATRTNGTAPLQDAIVSETGLADQAAAIRGDAVGLDAGLLLELLPLLRAPIPSGYIKTIGVVTGKPYESTGITSVQVQIDRMDNVLTPLGWRDTTEYHADGKLAHVRVDIIDRSGNVLASRDSWGGVDRASTQGNLRKGSYTNAAKVAFARIGPGHEVYVGATDLDPDVHQQTAELQARSSTAGDAAQDRELSPDEQQKIIDAFQAGGLTVEDMQTMYAALGKGEGRIMTVADAFALRSMLDEHVARKASA